LRSAKAGDEVAEALRAAGAEVEDEVLYDNIPVVRDAAKERLPDFDAVFFASASAVEAFLAEYGAETLTGRRVLVIGKPTREALPAELGASAEEFAWF
jgi:uroporphyrinogen-III synthase